MSAKPRRTPPVVPEERVTLEQIKHRAEEIGNLAINESKRIANDVYEQNVSKAVLVAVGVIVVAASLAYFMGSRAGRRAASPPPAPRGY